MTVISAAVSDYLYWGFLLILILNMTQRRSGAHRKRLATLFIAIAGFAMYVTAASIVYFGGKDWMLIPAVAIIVFVIYGYRSVTWPFRLRCPGSGRTLTIREIIYDDDPCEEDESSSSE